MFQANTAFDRFGWIPDSQSGLDRGTEAFSERRHLLFIAPFDWGMSVWGERLWLCKTKPCCRLATPIVATS
jgi:hypothetical protein